MSKTENVMKAVLNLLGFRGTTRDGDPLAIDYRRGDAEHLRVSVVSDPATVLGPEDTKRIARANTDELRDMVKAAKAAKETLSGALPRAEEVRIGLHVLSGWVAQYDRECALIAAAEARLKCEEK